MGYENKEYILQFFEGVHEKDNRSELIEVYRKAKAWDEVRRIMDYHYPDKEDRQGVRGYQHPKVALKNIGDVIEDYESGEYDAKK